MSEPMKPFDPLTNCPKCGGADVGTSYQKGHLCSNGEGAGCFDPEALVRQCVRCRFKWKQAPLDSARGSMAYDTGQADLGRQP